jgi:uncharacterized protein YndB with AHSA1/START domain
MLKKFLMVVGVLVIIGLIVPAFLSSHFSMSRKIEITAPVGVVFSKLTNLNEYIKWNPFPEGDPTNQANVTGDGVGSFLIWKGDKTGEGKMIITNIEPEKNIEIKMEFYKPMSGEGIVHWITNAKADSKTEMIWTFDQELTYFNRYFGLFMEAMMGQHFEKGLLNFKTRVESLK